jgi:hypothetical protein
MRTHPPVDFRRVPLYPTEDGDVVDSQPALSHHLLDISVAERVAAIPADAKQDDVWCVMTPLEGRGIPPHGLVMSRTCDVKEGRIIAEKQFLKHYLQSQAAGAQCRGLSVDFA